MSANYYTVYHCQRHEYTQARGRTAADCDLCTTEVLKALDLNDALEALERLRRDREVKRTLADLCAEVMGLRCEPPPSTRNNK